MTDRYRTKNCAYCNKLHKKRGKYCSRSCGNHRNPSPKLRQKVSNTLIHHWNTNDKHVERDQARAIGKLGIRQYHNKSDEDLQAMTLDDFMIEPQVKELPDNQFVAGGDLWTEAD
jgi:hypothetical protein